MFSKEYKDLLTEYKKNLKESETKKTISIYAYEKYYNKKLDELYENIMNLKKSKQLKYDFINKSKENLDKKISLYESCIQKDIEEFSLSIDNAYNKQLALTKQTNINIYKAYEKSVDSFSITFENTVERLNKEIERINKSNDINIENKIKEYNKNISIEEENLDNLYKMLSNEKSLNKDDYLKKNISINNKIRQTRNEFLTIEKNDSNKYNPLISKCDADVELAKNDLLQKNKNIIKDFNNQLNLIDKKYNVNHSTKYQELVSSYEKQLHELEKDKNTEIAKLESDHIIKSIRNKAEQLRLEFDNLKKKRKIEEQLINIDYENELLIIDIERSYNDSNIESNIGSKIALKTNELNVLKLQRDLIKAKELKLKEFDTKKINSRIKEISITNMLKCENEKILRDCKIDIEYHKLNITKINYELQKIVFENEKYIEFLDFCKLINLKNFSDIKDYYQDYYSSDSLISLYEKNIENAKTNYNTFQIEKLIQQQKTNFAFEKEFITNILTLLINDIKVNPKYEKVFKKLIRIFLLTTEHKNDQIQSQKQEYRIKSQNELKNYGYTRKAKIEKLRILENKMKFITESIDSLLGYMIYYENEITSLNEQLRSKIGSIDEITIQLNEYTATYNDYKSKYIMSLSDKKILEKEIINIERDIQYLTKKIETTKTKISSKNISNESIDVNIFYKKALEKIMFEFERPDRNNPEINIYDNILNHVNNLYDELFKNEELLLKNILKNHKNTIKSNIDKYKKELMPIKKEYNRNINDLNKSRNNFLNTYSKNLNSYKQSIIVNTSDAKYNKRIIYENIRQRKAKLRNDLIAFKRNSFEIKKSFENDLNNEYIKTLNYIKQKEKELAKFIKDTNDSKKEIIEKNKNTIKEIGFTKNNKLREASSHYKDRKIYTYEYAKKLNDNYYKKFKSLTYVHKDTEFEFKSLLKRSQSFYNNRHSSLNKEYLKYRKKSAK